MAGTLLAACGTPPPTTTLPFDLFAELSAAELEPADAPGGAARTDTAYRHGERRPVLVLQVPSRVTWDVHLVETAALVGEVTLLPTLGAGEGGLLTVGMSDGRTYEELTRRVFPEPLDGQPAWQSLHVDLSQHSGLRWWPFGSSGRVRDLILNVRGSEGSRIALLDAQIVRRALP